LSRQREEPVGPGAGTTPALAGRRIMSLTDSAGVLRSAASAAAPGDPRVTSALEEYLGALEAGHPPGRADFLARHADIAGPPGGCRGGLAFVTAGLPEILEPVESAPPGAAGLGCGVPLGDFRIVREVGRGGMGVVYEAQQLSLGRPVALKVLPFASTLDARQLQRFKNEAQAAAHLHHPNIVPIYATGCERGVHYYAMQFIDGRTVAAMIDELRHGPQTQGVALADVPTGLDVPTSPVAAASTELSRKDPA